MACAPSRPVRHDVQGQAPLRFVGPRLGAIWAADVVEGRINKLWGSRPGNCETTIRRHPSPRSWHHSSRRLTEECDLIGRAESDVCANFRCCLRVYIAFGSQLGTATGDQRLPAAAALMVFASGSASGTIGELGPTVVTLDQAIRCSQLTWAGVRGYRFGVCGRPLGKRASRAFIPATVLWPERGQLLAPS